MSWVASEAARFGQDDLADGSTLTGVRGRSCCWRTASSECHLGRVQPGDAGLRSGDSWCGLDCGRGRSRYYGAVPDSLEIYAGYPGTPTERNIVTH